MRRSWLVLFALAACRQPAEAPDAAPREERALVPPPAPLVAPPPTTYTAAPVPRVGPIADVACSAAACDPFVIAELPFDRGVSLALDGAGFAYVGPLYDDAIYRVALTPGSRPEVLYHSPGRDIGWIEIRGAIMRWSSNAAGTIYEAPLAGGGPIRVLADGLPGVWGFHSDEHTIYWTDFDGAAPGMVWRAPLGGGPSIGLGKDAASHMAVNLLVDGSSGDIIYSDRTARLLRLPADGGTPRAWVGLPSRTESHGLAQDESHIYLETLAGLEILRIDRRTTEIQRFATTERTPAAVAVDATTVYWLDYAKPVLLHARRK